MLGSSAAVFQVGNTVTLYLSTQAVHDAVNTVNLSVRDSETEEILYIYVCNPVLDAYSVPGFNPDYGDNVQYYSTTFTLDAAFANRSIDVIADVAGNNTTSQGVMTRAFSVIE
jgi:hypothetical protein